MQEMYEVEISEIRAALEEALLEKELEQQVEYSMLLLEAESVIENIFREVRS